jgi:poly(hydroxyalkanoate) granule-associated protein
MNMRKLGEAAQELPADVMLAGRQVWLAGLGAAGIVSTGGQAVFSMLVEEGKRVKQLRVAEVVDEVVDSAVAPMRRAVKSMDKQVQKTSKTVLARIGVPSRKEVEDLTDRVEQLIAKVESLNQHKRAPGARKGGRRAH